MFHWLVILCIMCGLWWHLATEVAHWLYATRLLITESIKEYWQDHRLINRPNYNSMDRTGRVGVHRAARDNATSIDLENIVRDFNVSVLRPKNKYFRLLSTPEKNLLPKMFSCTAWRKFLSNVVCLHINFAFHSFRDFVYSSLLIMLNVFPVYASFIWIKVIFSLWTFTYVTISAMT